MILVSPKRMALVLAPMALLLGGCGGEQRPDLYPVSGVVTYQGQPLANAEVVFHNDSAPRAAAGTTDAEGRFQLQSFEDFDGAVAGEHAVTITKLQANAEISGANADDPTAAYGGGMDAAASGNMSAIAKSELPEKYANPNSSGLKETVTAEGPNEFTFALE